MTSYVQGSLMPGEHVVYEGKISLWSLLPLIILGFLLIFVWGLGLMFWLAAFIRYQTTELAITNKRVIAKFGFISRRTVELSLNRIEGIQVIQGISGRIFNYGSLVVSGTGSLKEPIPGISNPLAFRQAFSSSHDAATARA
jgi:uncharacterized membrane protein YdbT with pleckstrin-like domain